MNLYTMVGSGNATPQAAALSARLAAWHDAMVAHERKIRVGRAEPCDEECPHAEARMLWIEALEIFGERAEELTFLRSRSLLAAEQSKEFVASPSVLSEAADRGRRTSGSRGKGERPRTETTNHPAAGRESSYGL